MQLNDLIFTGKIVPDLGNITLGTIPLKVNAVDAVLSFEAIISIVQSQIIITVKDIKGSDDLLELRNYIQTTLRPFIDSYNYSFGQGYDIELNKAINLSTGEPIIFTTDIPEISGKINERPIPFLEVLQLALNSQPLRHALGNLREAVRMHEDTGFFCYRAIESIRQHFCEENDKRDDKSWERLRNSLRINRNWIDPLRNEYEANQQRHGKHPYMSGDKRVLAMQHAWKVVDRFCIYLKNDSLPLSVDVEELKLP